LSLGSFFFAAWYHSFFLFSAHVRWRLNRCSGTRLVLLKYFSFLALLWFCWK
jgi:hypothetical protein